MSGQRIERERPTCPTAPSGRGHPERGNRAPLLLQPVNDGEPDRRVLTGVGMGLPCDVASGARRGISIQLPVLVAPIGVGQTVHHIGKITAIRLPQPSNDAPLVTRDGDDLQASWCGSQGSLVVVLRGCHLGRLSIL